MKLAEAATDIIRYVKLRRDLIRMTSQCDNCTVLDHNVIVIKTVQYCTAHLSGDLMYSA